MIFLIKVPTNFKNKIKNNNERIIIIIKIKILAILYI